MDIQDVMSRSHLNLTEKYKIRLLVIILFFI